MADDFATSFARLNDDQRKAVEHLDGPLIVIAGPGTGKTQLLSLRAANILRNRDIQPQNILCLTYTEAGAEAMTKRLIELIGKDGYSIEVNTFHGFASACRSRYPEYFPGASDAGVVSTLHAQEILNELLKALPFGGPLSGVAGGVATNIGAMTGFISTCKRQGLSPEEFRAITRQNLAAAEYLENADGFMDALAAPLPTKAQAKADFIDSFEQLALTVCGVAPEELSKNVIGTGGVYVPYIPWLHHYISSTPLMDGKKTTGFQEVRKALVTKADDGSTVLTLRQMCEKDLIAADIYEAYQARLAVEGLHDFDDMIMDFIAAVAENPTFRYALQERYRYIQVDEFQDTNAAQMRIVEMLCDGLTCPNVMAVGDDDQAIMRFQGASIACIDQFRSRFNPEGVVLKTNYRSTPEVVKLGQEVAEFIERRLPESATDKQIAAFRPSGEQTSYTETVFASQELELQALAKDIRRRIDEGFIANAKKPDEAISVIANKHSSLRALLPYLKAENIPYSYVQTSDLFALEAMQTTLALLRCVVALGAGNKALANSYLPQIVASAECGGDNISSINFALYAKREHYGDWLSALETTPDARLNALYADLVAWAAASPAAPVRELIYRITSRSRRYYKGLAKSEPLAFAEYNGGLRALLKFAESELATASALGRTMRLPDVIARLDRAAAFNVSIDASINLNTSGAVRLTSAHSSKGLEFDLVYILDAEQKMWHGKGAGGSKLFTPNMLIGSEKDEDDARRLLFVAITRAKDRLELYRAGGSTICELADLVGTVEVEPEPETLAGAIETSWRDSYALDTPELMALLAPNLPPNHLSATTLNEFVAYSEEAYGAATWPQKRVMRLPEAPSIALEYGTAVHAYFEEYVNKVLKGDADPVALAAHYRKLVAAMDFLPEDTERYARQFVRVADHAAAMLTERTEGLRLETEVKLTALAGDNVPLFGSCDLLLLNEADKTIRVIDYKTGFHYPEGEPDRGYQRQLQFYRLLIENSADYAGWHVVSCENWYVEPEKGTDMLHEPVASAVSDEDIAYMVQLMNAAWHRIARGDFDCSAFDNSPEKAAALDTLANTQGRVTKKLRATTLQIAYESWLIRTDGE